MPRKKREEEPVNHERWLVSYADFITLLFAFFVVMYAISQADMAKLKQVADSIQKAFGMKAQSLGMIDVGGRGAGGNQLNIFEPPVDNRGRAVDLPAGKNNLSSARDSDLKNLRDKLEDTISLEMGMATIAERPELIYDSEGLIIRLAIKDFFNPGEVSVERDLWPVLSQIGKVLYKGTRRRIRIEGHADISEAVGSKEAAKTKTWELSAQRAAWVAKFWMQRYEFEPSQIGIAGYGHFRPIREGESVWARGANRRIEIIVTGNEGRAKKRDAAKPEER